MAHSASRSVTPEEPSSKSRANRGVVGRTAAEIAALELAEFQQRQGADVDPDAPAAMKASPSGSEDGDIPRPSAMEDDGEVSQVQGATQGIRSRWQVDDEEEEEGAGAQANGVVSSLLIGSAIAYCQTRPMVDSSALQNAVGVAHHCKLFMWWYI